MKCNSRMAWVSVSIATTALVAACGGGSGGGGSYFPTVAATPPAAGGSPEVPPAPSPSPEPIPSQDPACLALPADGKEIAVTVASNIGVSLGVATLTNEGPKTFEGQSHPTLKVQSRLDQLIGRESRHLLHMLPDAPFLPAGATTYATDVNSPSSRYAYSYANMTLEQLNTAIKDGKVTYSFGPAFSIENWGSPEFFEQFTQAERRGHLAFPDLKPLMPKESDFSVGKPVTLLMLERQAVGTAPLAALYKEKVREITLTNAGRENVAVGDVEHPRACRFDIVVRTADAYLRSLGMSEITTRAATAWFGKDGLVKIELKGPGA
jgi:hypothetical protein